jgi:hypothetical protein
LRDTYWARRRTNEGLENDVLHYREATLLSSMGAPVVVVVVAAVGTYVRAMGLVVEAPPTQCETPWLLRWDSTP